MHDLKTGVRNDVNVVIERNGDVWIPVRNGAVDLGNILVELGEVPIE